MIRTCKQRPTAALMSLLRCPRCTILVVCLFWCVHYYSTPSLQVGGKILNNYVKYLYLHVMVRRSKISLSIKHKLKGNNYHAFSRGIYSKHGGRIPMSQLR